MTWKRSISAIMGMALSLFSPSKAFGDTFVGESAFTGRVKSMDNENVYCYDRCNNGGKVIPIPWSSLDGFRFDEDCKAVVSIPVFYSAFNPDPSKQPERTRVLKIRCKNREVFHAKFIFLNGDIFKATSFKDDLTITCSEEELRNLVETISCDYYPANKVPQSTSIPKGFRKSQ